MFSPDLAHSLLSQINISILPVILLPVTGLSLLVFYNRLAALNGFTHTLQREIRDHFVRETSLTDKEKTILKTLNSEYQIVLKRSHLIRQGIKLCFSALFLFAFSAFTVILGAFWIHAIFLTLFLWAMGAFAFALGIVYGFTEMKQMTLHNLQLETELIEDWMHLI